MGGEEKKQECKHPDKLRGKPGECSAEQIRECHGDEPCHPCAEKPKQ